MLASFSFELLKLRKRLAVWVFCLVSIQFSREPTRLWAAI